MNIAYKIINPLNKKKNVQVKVNLNILLLFKERKVNLQWQGENIMNGLPVKVY
jgi:hypothetical protein